MDGFNDVPVGSANGKGTDGVFCQVVGDWHLAVVQKCRERLLWVQGISHGILQPKIDLSGTAPLGAVPDVFIHTEFSSTSSTRLFFSYWPLAVKFHLPCHTPIPIPVSGTRKTDGLFSAHHPSVVQ